MRDLIKAGLVGNWRALRTGLENSSSLKALYLRLAVHLGLVTARLAALSSSCAQDIMYWKLD